MAYTNKKYARINWQNLPAMTTALGATNMNHMDVFLNEVDNALIEMGKAEAEYCHSELHDCRYYV